MATDIKTKTEETQLSEDMRMAEEALQLRIEALKRRKESPNGIALGESVSALDELARIALPDAFWSGPRTDSNPRGSRAPSKHHFWGTRTDHVKYISKGYVPVARNGKHVSHEEMLLYWIPQELYESQLKANGRESTDRLRQTIETGDAIDKDPKVKSLTDEQIETKTQSKS